MDKSLLGAFQKMGSNFMVAAFVPSMGFFVITLVSFYRLLSPQLQDYLVSVFKSDDMTPFVQFGVVILIIVMILGFTLYSLSTYIYKAFEGYSFILGPNSFIKRSFIRRQIYRYNKIESERVYYEKQMIRLNNKISAAIVYSGVSKWHDRRIKRYVDARKRLGDQHYGLISNRNAQFPPSSHLILPTRFGNVLRASETYPGTKYAIDAVPLWGRLAHVIPKAGMEKLDDANNQCLFLLNTAVLATLFSMMCLITTTYMGCVLLIHDASTNISLATTQENAWLYLVLSITAIAVAWLFYEASLLNVGQYGDMIRTAYDLYRFKLLEALHLELPKTLKDEKMLWRSISNFVVGNDKWELIEGMEIMEKHAVSPMDNYPYNHPRTKTV